MNQDIRARVNAVDWQRVAADLDQCGHARTKRLLRAVECRSLMRTYGADERFRTTIDMAPRRYGEGQYRYFDYPLPDVVDTLRTAFYPPLARIANDWMARLGERPSLPRSHRSFVDACHAAGQKRATPLLLSYETGGFNCLHQDLYGEVAFPLQVVILLSRQADFAGGEFLLVEQRPRQQSRGEAIALQRGEALIFPNAYRPVEGTRGSYRATVRHGVSTVRSGQRMTLGIIFHDAK